LYTLYQTAKKEGKRSLDVAISVGVHPAVLLAAASPAPFDVNEFDVANALLKGELKLTKCENIDVNVPANSEIVFEGRILLDKEAPEGPFVDVTGTYDIVRLQPVVELVGVMRRKNHVYQALLPAGLEHKLFMGLARKVKIWETVRKVVPTVRSVKLTEGSGGWLHALISIRKETENDGKNVISAAFSAHPSLKHVFVVDEDIDVDNLIEVEWALATRFQGDEDLVILKNVKGSTLDPSANQETGLTTKVGFDLTRPLSKPPEKFKKAVIPENSNVKRILNQILNTKDGTLKLE
ncbi:UbiD family decarboxylase, partial [Candidatus Bathyarchaeota archaeon]